MSDPSAKARRSAAKDARQQPAPDTARPMPKKKPKPDRPWHVVGRSGFNFQRDREFTWYKCATEEQAIAMMEKDKRSRLQPHLCDRRVVYRPKGTQ